jgi:hypothetical protein
MNRPGLESVLLLPPDLERLKRFVHPLNTEFSWTLSPIDGRLQRVPVDYRPVQQELRRLVQAWFESGPNVSKLFAADPVLARAALHFPAHIVATDGATARLLYVTVPDSRNPGEPLTIALGLFLSFLLNPFNTRLRGPCAQCGKYFVMKNKRQKVYCSTRCGRTATSLAVNRKRRAREHNERLQTARKSISKWLKSTRTPIGWKEWVHRETRISKHWLTRAVRNGELKESIKRAK